MAGGRVTCKCGQERPFNVINCPHCTHRQENSFLDNVIGIVVFIFIVFILMNIG